MAIPLAFAGLFVLTGCDGADSVELPVRSAVKCFPKAAQRWIVTNATARPDKMAEAASGKATVYIDRSGSMVGYLNGATNIERPLHDLIDTLPGSLKLVGLRTAFRSFGTGVSGELPGNGKELLQPATFTCKAAQDIPCDNTESRLDVVLSQVKSRNDDLAVIVSDLWFSNSEIQSTGIAALQPVLTELLFADRAIAIYGIDAPFSGKIYDLPQAGSGHIAVPYAGRHPLYMMVVGTKQAVLDLDKVLADSGSRNLAEGRATGRIVRTLFTVDPGPLHISQDQPLGPSKHPGVRKENFEIPPGVSIQRFVMTPAQPQPRGAAQPQSPSWTGPQASQFLPDAVWTGLSEARTRIWLRTSKECGESAWSEQKPGTYGWGEPAADGQRTFSLDPAKFGATFMTEGTYLVSGETRRVSVMRPNPATAWMRGEWNLDPAMAETVARSYPSVFPTLNLSEFGRIMEAALASAAERKDQPITGFAVMVKVED